MERQLPKNVKTAVDDIIKCQNYKSQPKVVVTQGSEAGDGYASKTYAISIEGKGEKTINLFVKCLPEMNVGRWRELFVQNFQTEFKFYNKVYPAFRDFQQKKNIQNPFDNVPQYYKTDLSDCDVPPIILENLRNVGYNLRDRKKPVDDAHLKLPIKAFARYHAISYAMKDQEPKIYCEITPETNEKISDLFKEIGMFDSATKCVSQFLEGLDPVADNELLERCKNLSEIILQGVVDIFETTDEYSVICQGDCWSNNMMFSYDTKTDLPVDVKLIDWQGQGVISPLVDFSYFFYTLATKEVLENADFYLNLYYETLSQRITELGSDPEKMYPKKIFLDHWRKCAVYGLFMAFQIVKIQLFDQEEIPDLHTNPDMMSFFGGVLKDQDKYIARMKALVEYFIDKKLL